MTNIQTSVSTTMNRDKPADVTLSFEAPTFLLQIQGSVSAVKLRIYR
jgi:hypothetical protein